MNIEICQADLFIPGLLTLMNQLDAYQSALYPYENNHAESLDSLAQIETFVYVVKYEEGIVGCAILARPKTPYSEIKRVFVSPDYRGQGVAQRLITALLHQANALILKKIHLETGVYQPEAIKLYQRLGFELTSQFGRYEYDPLSVYMMQSLASGRRANHE
ncbi:GNAT family N-acetyltransferase [Yersinia enterocolitica]|uniref:GNAT family N-acetyltransferase n=1 Tax=Yersinia enterocolitica TaxID=630 RepID=UPI0028A378C4|nr:GNAT family N-acetyltransferase [Yersinia enterocolitica]HDL7339705.1 GNAT family N-acetyltransferase [Yersinia enterocolitica]HDL7429921.1 GNAT family N-acetyltransferase [Yersinia enterocolitica]HDL7434250.1 GNAT family N-acetyltransferase [Yersinia enterocolitica]HDL7476659.1 GNAT family N-acetyltransferase [Yersinia enterocolitica]